MGKIVEEGKVFKMVANLPVSVGDNGTSSYSLRLINRNGWFWDVRFLKSPLYLRNSYRQMRPVWVFY